MKNILAYETFLGIVFSIIIVVIIAAALIWATEPEQWYVGMHDSKCEKSLHDEPCNCYERLVAVDKASNNK